VRSPLQVPTRRERQRDLTRARLLEAALAEFRRAGFDRASITRIARSAGVSRASFYFHFPTREHVLMELQWRLEQRAVERMRACRSLREALTELVEAVLEAEDLAGDPELYRDLLRIHVRRSEGPPPAEAFPVSVELERHFLEAAERGELRRGLEPRRAAELCLASVFGFLIGPPRPTDSQREGLRTLVSLYLPEEPR
jgi:AcrR family transcriptional regulator